MVIIMVIEYYNTVDNNETNYYKGTIKYNKI